MLGRVDHGQPFCEPEMGMTPVQEKGGLSLACPGFLPTKPVAERAGDFWRWGSGAGSHLESGPGCTVRAGTALAAERGQEPCLPPAFPPETLEWGRVRVDVTALGRALLGLPEGADRKCQSG